MNVRAFAGAGLLVLVFGSARAAQIPEYLADWSRPTTIVQTSIAMEVCVEPPMRRERNTHDPLYATLADLQADYSRLAFWYPYPRLAVAELEPPTPTRTSWDFSLLDPIVADFMQATRGHPIMMNVSTIPQWMFKTAQRVGYPTDPDEIDWAYEQGTEPRDPSLKEVRDYVTRVVSWYTQGGFQDELGQRHDSGHHFKFDVWEVLNEVDYEHRLTPQLYTRIYDEIVAVLRKQDPQMKFSGPALAAPARQPEFLEYFLDHRHHRPGIPLDFVSYHFYAAPERDESPETWEHTFFTQMDGYVSEVRALEVIRKKLSPATRTYINELGTMTANNFAPTETVSDNYWSLSGAAFAYAYIGLVKLQIDLIGGAELINYPGQFPGASVTDWNTGQPNERYRVMKLLRERIIPGDRVVQETDPEVRTSDEKINTPPRYYAALGLVSADGGRKVLLVNKRHRPLQIRVPGARGGRVEYVDIGTKAAPPASKGLDSDTVNLAGFAVAIVDIPH